jgi:hypothetical protein
MKDVLEFSYLEGVRRTFGAYQDSDAMVNERSCRHVNLNTHVHLMPNLIKCMSVFLWLDSP